MWQQIWGKIVSLWQQRRYVSALILVLLGLLLFHVGLYLMYPTALVRERSFVGKFAIWIAESTGELKHDQEGSKSPVAQKPAGIPYLALSRIQGESGQTMRVVPYGDGTVSVQWKFSAYVLRQWERTDNDSWQLKKTVPMTELLAAGRKFRFGGLILDKEPTGVWSVSKFFYQDFRPSRTDWLQTKFVSERGGLCIGTIYFGPLLPNYMAQIYGGFIGKMIDGYPLSLEDPSFPSVSLRSLSDNGIVSLTAIFGPLFGSVLEGVLPPDRHHVLAFKVTGPKSIEFIARGKGQ